MDQHRALDVSDEKAAQVTCAACQAANAESRTNCWLCSAQLDQAPRLRQDAAAARRPRGVSFTLSSLMLLVALFAVCFGVMRLSLGLGIALAIAAVPALVRTSLAAIRRKGRSRPMDMIEKVVAFMASLGIVTAIGVASVAAFFATFFATCIPIATVDSGGYFAVYSAIALGILAGAVVCYFLLRWHWPQRN